MAGQVSLQSVNLYPQLLATDADTIKRTTYGGNETSSEYDFVFTRFRDSNLPLDQKAPLADWRFRLENSMEAIHLHVEKRVSQVFAQAVMCYRTGYIFREGHTFMQGLSEEKIPTPSGLLGFAGAHHATVPCLYARSPDSNQEIVFQYGSGIFKESNATLGVIEAVNNADRAIDEKYKDSLLRDKTIALFNLAAKGELTPEQVTRQFLIDLNTELNKSIAREKDVEVKNILQAYLRKSHELWDYVQHPDHIDRWLGLQLDDPVLTETRNTVEALKHDVPVPQANILKVIKSKIEHVPIAIRHMQHQLYNKSRAPVHFQDLYMHEVFSRLSPLETPTVEAATGVARVALANKIVKFQRIGKTQGILTQHADKIDALVNELRPLIAKANGKQVSNDQLTGLSERKKVCLRPKIYQLRYRMIQADQNAQSAINSKVEQVLNSLKGKGRSHVETHFYAALLQRTRNETEKLMLCKLLNLSSAQIAQKICEIKTNQKVHPLLERHASLISRLSADIDNASRALVISPQTKTLLMERISKLRQQMTAQLNTKTLLPLFYRRLFDQAMSTTAHALLQELLQCNVASLDQRIVELRPKKISTVEILVNNNAHRIDEVAQVFFSESSKLIETTKTFRRKLMVELRLSHGMSQNHFKTIYKSQFPGNPMSDGTMSNLETGKKDITAKIVGHLAAIFGVSSSLFYSSHFAEVL